MEDKSMRIKTTAIIGMGALGLLFGEQIVRAKGKDSVCFVMDSARYEKHKADTYTINDQKMDFQLLDVKNASPVDFIIIATKYNGLQGALDIMEPLIGTGTVVISLLNGISSEEMIAARYQDIGLVHCVAIGMDAMREDTSLHYTNKGRLQIGVVSEQQRPALEAVQAFLEETGIPYEEKADILHAMWGKFLLNVGINQTCMVYDTTYEGALTIPEARASLSKAMHEVIAIAQKEGVNLTEEDYQNYIKVLYTLNPNGYPSMRQDALAGRKSEVELFAGTVLAIAGKHQVPVPVNTWYYQRIQEMEAGYSC